VRGSTQAVELIGAADQMGLQETCDLRLQAQRPGLVCDRAQGWSWTVQEGCISAEIYPVHRRMTK
jgi:hypothetical protein